MVSDPGDWKLTSSPLLEAGKPGGSRCFVDGWTAEAGEWTTTCNRERYATKCDARYDKSTFGTCNTPWSTYISTQERRMPFAGILNRDGPLTLKFKVEDPHFQFQLKKKPKMHIWWFYLKSITSYRTDKPNFLEFLVKIAKMTFKVKVKVPHFLYQLRVFQEASLMQIWWF